MKNRHTIRFSFKPLLYMALLAMPLLLLSGCGNGAGSIPELSAMLLKAVNAKSEKKFQETIPTVDGMQQAYIMYFPDQKLEKEQQKADALDKAASHRLNLIQDFRKVVNDADDKGIPLGKLKLNSFPFTQKDRSEGFKEAEVRMQLLDESNKPHTLRYTAYLMDGKWFVMDDVRWE